MVLGKIALIALATFRHGVALVHGLAGSAGMMARLRASKAFQAQGRPPPPHPQGPLQGDELADL